MDLPNILIIMTDQQKATASHLYGSPFCQTPSLERLARSGVTFDQAYTPHPLCVPARVSLWTSQYPHTHGSQTNQTLMRPGTYHAARVWKEAGYHLGLIGKNHCFEQAQDLALFDTWCEISHEGLPKASPPRGLDWFRPVEKIQAAHRPRRNMPLCNPRFGYTISDFPLEDYSTGLVAGQTARFLDKHRNEPFVLWVSFPDPHGPWQVPREYASLFPPDAIELPPGRADEFNDGTAPERYVVLHEMMGIENDPIDQVKGLMGAYSGMLRFVDDGVGQILNALEALGLREKTIVVFCSDHGEFMAEHQMQGKGGAFYDCLTRIPLIVSWPGQIRAGVRDSSLTSLIDIVPTLFRLQGLPAPASMEGRLLPTITSAPSRDAVFAEYGAGGPPFRLSDLEKKPGPFGRKAFLESLQWREAEGRRKMLRTQEWKFVHDPMGDKDELYDLVNDPWELTNLAANPAHREVADEMGKRLTRWAAPDRSS